MYNKQLILIRHGESTWNKLNRFTGWTDVELSNQGKKEAQLSGQILKKKKINFDYCYTSLLKRAIHTLWIILNELDQVWLTVKKTWRLNERHYGNLQGLNKDEIATKYGDKIVNQWRRSFTSVPPKMKNTDNWSSCNDERYKNLKNNEIPSSESLELTLNRVLPFWKNNILPKIQQNNRILIVAHGNSLRALMKYLSHLNNEEIIDLHIPTGVPIVYNLNNTLCTPMKYSFLKNDE
ncbi:2,3-diphosphoglycerate-dependent phosphoglycerate mutase [Buchnera aphidicola]|uniref:2,3-diphosphoglycerate-dependent phosphoglycerate mutase n=1 Tax=Buchnera aphidicola TaxID=9 RepID=UPI003463ECF7